MNSVSSPVSLPTVSPAPLPRLMCPAVWRSRQDGVLSVCSVVDRVQRAGPVTLPNCLPRAPAQVDVSCNVRSCMVLSMCCVVNRVQRGDTQTAGLNAACTRLGVHIIVDTSCCTKEILTLCLCEVRITGLHTDGDAHRKRRARHTAIGKHTHQGTRSRSALLPGRPS